MCVTQPRMRSSCPHPHEVHEMSCTDAQLHSARLANALRWLASAQLERAALRLAKGASLVGPTEHKPGCMYLGQLPCLSDAVTRGAAVNLAGNSPQLSFVTSWLPSLYATLENR